jgi:hypothetical protein
MNKKCYMHPLCLLFGAGVQAIFGRKPMKAGIEEVKAP